MRRRPAPDGPFPNHPQDTRCPIRAISCLLLSREFVLPWYTDQRAIARSGPTLKRYWIRMVLAQIEISSFKSGLQSSRKSRGNQQRRLVSPSLFPDFSPPPAPISPNSQTPTRRRGSCRARKHALSNSNAKAIAIMVLFFNHNLHKTSNRIVAFFPQSTLRRNSASRS